MAENVILVDTDDNEIGTEEKMVAHEKALLHRAFSVFIFNTRGELLLQQRAKGKYHSAGLWTNTCCSHPRKGESVEEAAHRRLMEEMGFDCDLRHAFTFTYKAPFSNGLTEHEIDHVLIGTYDHEPTINRQEADSSAWRSVHHLLKDIDRKPHDYTPWFKIALPLVEEFLRKQ